MANRILRPIRIVGNVAFIPLTKGFEAIIDASDLPLVETHNWCVAVGRNIYAICKGPTIAGKRQGTIRMHRLIMPAPDEMDVDHMDGDGLNNRRDNLRIVTPAQNTQNQKVRSSNKSGFKGVCWSTRDKKWYAAIRSNGTIKRLGSFHEVSDAAAAYAKASAELHGEFGRLG